MACNVSIKDIQRDVKNRLFDNFSDAGIKSSIEREGLFVPFTSTNKSTIRKDVKEVTEKIEETFQHTKYGRMISIENMDYGLRIVVNPSEKLADDMTAQNYNDELAQQGNNIYMGDQALEDQNEEYNSRYNQNIKKPITDNFVEYINHKEAQLVQIKKELRRLNIAQRNPKNNISELKKEAQKLAIISNGITTQIEELKKNDVDLLFHAVATDLDLISSALDNTNAIKDISNIQNKIGFYHEFITGKKYDDNRIDTNIESIRKYNNPAFDKLLSKLDEVKSKYDTKTVEEARKIVEENVEFVKLTEVISEQEVDELFKAQADLNWLEKNFLGITSSKTNDTILPQIYMSEFKKIYGNAYAYTEKLSLELNDFLHRTKIKDFSFMFEKDAKGNRTGSIINVFSPSWYMGLGAFENRVGEFMKNKTQPNYGEATKWLNDNAEIVDFRKLKVFKDTYSALGYQDYFKFSDAEMDAYEDRLSKQLGPKYEETIEQLHNRLLEFEAIKENNLNSQNRYKERNIAKANIWEFTRRFSDGQPLSVQYLSGQNTYETYYENLTSLTMFPKATKNIRVDGVMESIDSGFYNEEFKNVLQDSEKLEYWNMIKEMSEYVDSTFGTEFHGRLSYPKILKDYQERFTEAVHDKTIKSSAKVMHDIAHNYKTFFYEQGRYREDKEIVANYQDNSKREIGTLAKTYIQQGMKKDEAYSKASADVLKNYSDDINRNMLATLMDAALHNARMEFNPIGEALLQDFRNITYTDATGKEKTRKNAIERLEYAHKKIILNQTERNRDSMNFFGITWSTKTNWLQKTLTLVAKLPLFNKIFDEKSGYSLNDVEKKLYAELKTLREQGASDSSTFSFTAEGFKHIKDGTQYFVIDDNGKPVAISKESFDRVFAKHIEKKIEDLGLDLNLAGVIQGTLKTIIYKALALNPLSGAFNRIEGKHSGMIMDQTNYYWTKGNYAKASHQMAFANVVRLSSKFSGPLFNEKKDFCKKMEAFNRAMNVIQDRKNELQRNTEASAYKSFLSLNIFSLAVDNPEFKNQGSIFLSILMDSKVKDINGVEHSINDGNKFTIWDLDGDKLVLKPEFRTPENIENWENFEGSETTSLASKLTSAVGKSQGNYDPFDIMLAKKNIWGRAGLLFMNWFPEHFNQRFGTGKGTDLQTGKKRQSGRYTATYKASKGAWAGHAMGSLALLYGAFGLPIAVVGGGIAALVYKKFFHNLSSDEEVAKDSSFILDFATFYKSVLIQTLNYPLDLANVKPSMRLSDSSFNNRNMSEEDLGAIHAMGKELAIMLTALSLKMLMASLTWDDDDDKDSPRRKFYNFSQNQLSKTIRSLASFRDPIQLKDDLSRTATLAYVDEVIKTVSMIWDEKQRKNMGKNLLSVTPLPRIVVKGELPWQNKAEYDNIPSMTGIHKSLSWSTTLMNRTEEQNNESEYKEMRKERRDELRDQFLEEGVTGKSALKKKVDEQMNLEFPNRETGESASSMLDRIEEGEKGKVKPKRKASKKVRDRRVEELKDEGLSSKEISKIMSEEFKGR